MSMEFSPIYHPGPLVRYCLLAIMVFPFASIAVLKWKPRMPLGYFFLPLILGALLVGYTLYEATLSAPLTGRPSRIAMSAAIADAVMSLFFGAGSSFGTALLQIRSRRRGLIAVLAVSAAVMVGGWAVVNHYIRIARGASASTSSPARTP
jgi:hypothetical protein